MDTAGEIAFTKGCYRDTRHETFNPNRIKKLILIINE